jgi:hypothetical protein
MPHSAGECRLHHRPPQGAFREIVTVIVAFTRKSIGRHDLLERVCRRHVECARRSFAFSNQRLDDAGSAPKASPIDVSVHIGVLPREFIYARNRWWADKRKPRQVERNSRALTDAWLRHYRRRHCLQPEAVGGSVLASVVTRLMGRGTSAQVWMDHICFRPAAASGFRLALKDGAEPSLGRPGPE